MPVVKYFNSLLAVTTDIHNMTTTLASYKTCPGLQCDVQKLGTTEYQVAGVGPFTIEVVDSVDCYVDLMKQIFDFALLKNFLSSFPVLLDCMNGGGAMYKHMNIISYDKCLQFLYVFSLMDQEY